MQIEPIPSSTEPHRDPFAVPHLPQRTPSTSSTVSTTSTTSTPPRSSPEPPDFTSSRSTPRPRAASGHDENSAAAMALLGLSMRTSGEAPKTTPSPNPQLGPGLSAVAMTVTLSSGSESGSSDTGSTGSTRVSSQKKRRSSDSSGDGPEPGENARGKRTRGTRSGSGGSPPILKPKTDGWSEEMKRSYEEAAFALPPSGREQRRFLGDMRGRNEQLGLWVTLEIGTYCGRKRISSHSQTLKNHHGTNPELKKVLTTDGSGSGSIADSSAWPLRLKQLVYEAFASLPSPPRLPQARDLDLASLPVPAITVRVLRKDGVEIEMTLPDAIEYDKADQRAKNREKKPVSRSRGKKSRTATPAHSRAGSTRNASVSSSVPARPPVHARTTSSSTTSDRPARNRQHSSNSYATSAAIPSSPLYSPHYRSESDPAATRSSEPSSAPAYFGYRPFGEGSRELPPPVPSPQSSSVPLADRMPPPPPGRYSSVKRSPERGDEAPGIAARPRQPHAHSLDFILADPLPSPSEPKPRPEAAGSNPSLSSSQPTRTFWK